MLNPEPPPDQVLPPWRGACQGTRTCQGGLIGDSRARVPAVVSSQGLHRQRDPEPGCFLTVMTEAQSADVWVGGIHSPLLGGGPGPTSPGKEAGGSDLEQQGP